MTGQKKEKKESSEEELSKKLLEDPEDFNNLLAELDFSAFYPPQTAITSTASKDGQEEVIKRRGDQSKPETKTQGSTDRTNSADGTLLGLNGDVRPSSQSEQSERSNTPPEGESPYYPHFAKSFTRDEREDSVNSTNSDTFEHPLALPRTPSKVSRLPPSQSPSPTPSPPGNRYLSQTQSFNLPRSSFSTPTKPNHPTIPKSFSSAVPPKKTARTTLFFSSPNRSDSPMKQIDLNSRSSTAWGGTHRFSNSPSGNIPLSGPGRTHSSLTGNGLPPTPRVTSPLGFESSTLQSITSPSDLKERDLPRSRLKFETERSADSLYQVEVKQIFRHQLKISMQLTQKDLNQEGPIDKVVYGEITRNVRLRIGESETSERHFVMGVDTPESLEGIFQQWAGSEELGSRIFQFLRIGASGSGIFADMSLFDNRTQRELAIGAQNLSSNLGRIDFSKKNAGDKQEYTIAGQKYNFNKNHHIVLSINKSSQQLTAEYEAAYAILQVPKDIDDVGRFGEMQHNLLNTSFNTIYEAKMTADFQDKDTVSITFDLNVAIDFLPIFTNEFEFEVERQVQKAVKRQMHDKKLENGGKAVKPQREFIDRCRAYWRKKLKKPTSIPDNKATRYIDGEGKIDFRLAGKSIGYLDEQEFNEDEVNISLMPEGRFDKHLRDLIIESVLNAQRFLISQRMALPPQKIKKPTPEVIVPEEDGQDEVFRPDEEPSASVPSPPVSHPQPKASTEYIDQIDLKAAQPGSSRVQNLELMEDNEKLTGRILQELRAVEDFTEQGDEEFFQYNYSQTIQDSEDEPVFKEDELEEVELQERTDSKKTSPASRISATQKTYDEVAEEVWDRDWRGIPLNPDEVATREKAPAEAWLEWAKFRAFSFSFSSSPPSPSLFPATRTPSPASTSTPSSTPLESSSDSNSRQGNNTPTGFSARLQLQPPPASTDLVETTDPPKEVSRQIR